MHSRFLLVCLFMVAGPAGASYAQTVPPSRYRVDVFTSEEGLPGHQVFDIDQTRDGYLWVATNGGLARFDGHLFRTYDTQNSPLEGNIGVRGLYVDATDTLFAVSVGGQVLGGIGSRFSEIAKVDDYYESTLQEMAKDREGRLWGNYYEDVLRREGDRMVLFSDSLVSVRGEKQLFVDGDGDVWLMPFLAVHDGCMARSGRPAPIRLENGAPVSRGETLFSHVISYPSLQEMLFSRMKGAHVVFANFRGEERGRYLISAGACVMLIDRTGNLWTKEGPDLVVYAPDDTVAVSRIALSLPPDYLPPWLEDREGNLWIGTFTQGLIRIQRQPFDVYSSLQGLDQGAVLTMVAGKQGSVLVLGRNYTYHRIAGPRASRAPEVIKGLYETDAGVLFYHADNGLFRVFGGQKQHLGDISERGGSLSYQIYPDPQQAGVLWTHDYETVYRLEDALGSSPVFRVALADIKGVRQLLKDRSGALWVATNNGLHRLEGMQVTHFTTANGLPDDRVRAIHEDPNGDLWFGTYGGGLVRYRDDQFRTVTEGHGLAENIVSSILEDDAGYFWMSGNEGVHRAFRPDLNAVLDGQRNHITSVLYGRESGLLNPEASGLQGLKAPNGNLWFPTFEGAAVVDPVAAIQMDQEPPLVHVHEIRVDNVSRPALGPVHLTADQRRFEIDYVGLNLRNPQAVQYRYRLDGFDADWVEAGTSRRATYTNVTPGRHTFRVQARNFAGVWNEQDGLLELRIDPRFNETVWFYLLCISAVCGLGMGGYRARIGQMKSREEMLNKQVQERTQALEKEKETVAAQARELRSLDEAKSRLFANISHEFRTPLTLILGPLEDVQQGRHGSFSSGGGRQISTAIDNGKRLLRLVNQLLEVARLESGKVLLQAREGDFVQTISRLYQAFMPMAERKRIDFRFEQPNQPLVAFYDAEQFEKIVFNLLGNAFKFTPDGGLVRLAVCIEEKAGVHRAVLTVQDNGPGISPEDQVHLFERFYQADTSSTRKQSGTGIGLALVKQLVELHHGTVQVVSQPGQGTTFTVRIPLGSEHLSPEEVMPPQPEEGKDGAEYFPILSDELYPNATAELPISADDPEADQTTILVVDDNPDIRAYVCRHLRQQYRVMEAADGKQALAAMAHHLPDLVVTDVMMPELDGFGLCQAIRQTPEWNFIPLIMLTAKASTDSRIEGLEEGADDYLTKPFSVRELEVRVENLIASRQRLKQWALAQGGQVNGVEIQAGSGRTTPPMLARIEAVIEARLAEEAFGVAALAEAVGMGRSTLYRQLDETCGLTPNDLIWKMRLDRAATLLRNRQGKVSEVAYGVGFKSVAHFCNRFRDRFGQSPTEFVAHHTLPKG